MVIRNSNHVKNIYIENAVLKLEHKSQTHFRWEIWGNDEVMSLGQSVISSVTSYSKEKSTVTRLSTLL